MGFVLDKPDQILMFHMLAQLHALQLEVEHGIYVNPAQRRRSLAKHIRETYGIEGRTKRQTLDNFITYLKARGVVL